MATARSLALRALVALERGRSERLKPELDGHGLEGRDLAFAYELSHGVLRRQRLLDHVLTGFAHRGLPKDPQLKVALRMGVHQLLFVAGMPAHAAVNETVALVKSNRGFANAMLRHVAAAVASRPADDAKPTTELALAPERTFVCPNALPDDEVARLAIVHSLPDWLVQRFHAEHGVDGVRRIAAAASATPGIFLRCSRDVTRATLQEELAAADVQTEPCEHERLLRWTGGDSPFGTAPFRVGRFVVQDPTALAAAEAVPVEAGDTVIDLCAAPGTKTTWLGEQVGDGGRVFAFDPDAPRRARIVDNAERLRLEQIVTVVDDVAALPHDADAVLADVPCSNSGVLGRRVEARRRLTPETFTELAELQRQLLRQALAATRPGGHVVYSTCSIDRDENAAVVAAVLAEDGAPPSELLREHVTLPLAGQHDGGYFAVLRRREVR